MNPLMIYLSIAQSVATGLLQGRSDPAKVTEWTGYLSLATALAGLVTAGNDDLSELDSQLKEAVAAGRGLTPEQRAAWRQRDDIATEVATQWLAEHPEERS
jgi:hypothetical protein